MAQRRRRLEEEDEEDVSWVDDDYVPLWAVEVERDKRRWIEEADDAERQCRRCREDEDEEEEFVADDSEVIDDVT